MAEEVAVRVGKQTKWISGLTEKTTCKVSLESSSTGCRRFMSWTPLLLLLLTRICLKQVFLHTSRNMQSKLQNILLLDWFKLILQVLFCKQ